MRNLKNRTKTYNSIYHIKMGYKNRKDNMAITNCLAEGYNRELLLRDIP